MKAIEIIDRYIFKLGRMDSYRYAKYVPDCIYLKARYRVCTGEKLNLRKPKTYTDKLNWLKIHDRKPIYTVMADKYLAKYYVAGLIGNDYIIPTLGAWDRYEDIDFDKLPEKFVLKCNHDSHSIFICLDKSSFDHDAAKKKLNERVSMNYYWVAREWPYKDIKRKIIAEEFIENKNGEDLVDYKVFCMNEKPKFVMVNSNRMGEGGVKTDIYDTSWNYLGIQDCDYPMAGDIFEKPVFLDELLSLAKILCKGMPNIRVDFNYWNGKLYFGELTFFHCGGMQYFQPQEWNKTVGNWLDISELK